MPFHSRKSSGDDGWGREEGRREEGKGKRREREGEVKVKRIGGKGKEKRED